MKELIKKKANTLTLLKGNGDFRSAECIEFLNEADIVVTNPPFSLFREYVAQIIEYDKKYPEYGFAKHKGYGTKAHIEAIKKYGLTPIHRPSFCKKFV